MAQKLLIIDDSLMLLRFAANVLSQQWPDLEITTAKRGSEGVARAQSVRPDLILLDFVLPDLLGDEVCMKLHQQPETSDTPIVVMSSGSAEVQDIEQRHPNVVKTINKPFTPELLVATIRSLFEDQQASRVTPLIRIRERLQLPEIMAGTNGKGGLAPRQVLLRGDTGAFSLRSVLHAIRDGSLTGCLRVQPPKGRPTETYAREGKILLTTSRDSLQYRDRATEVCRGQPPVVLETVLQGQADSGCPFPLLLALRDALPQANAIKWTDQLGRETFSRHWVGDRLSFEFEKLPVFPDWLSRYDGPATDVEQWISMTLRCIGPADLPAPSPETLEGVPAYTRDGYELVQRLALTDLESAFALRVNGATPLREIAVQLQLPTQTVFVLLFRFLALEAIELWPGSIVAATEAAAVAPETEEEVSPLARRRQREPEFVLEQDVEEQGEPESGAEPAEDVGSQALKRSRREPAPSAHHHNGNAGFEVAASRGIGPIASPLETPPAPRSDFVAIAATHTDEPQVDKPESGRSRRNVLPEMKSEDANDRLRKTTPRIAHLGSPQFSAPVAVSGQPKRFTVRIS